MLTNILVYLPLGAALSCPRLPNQDQTLTCADGTKCSIEPKATSQDKEKDVYGWGCCVEHGGRTNCPISAPVLCSEPFKCAEGRDFCCAKSDTDCNKIDAGLPMCSG